MVFLNVNIKSEKDDNIKALKHVCMRYISQEYILNIH